jgi:DNA polymerase I-like protein with 3'-5' exonuclease and polymerase domains
VEHDDEVGGTLRRVPHVLLTVDEVEQAVALYRDRPNFVFDVESTLGGAARNELRWIGIGAEGLLHLIPTGHPKGAVLKLKHKAKTAACLFYPPDDPRAYTPSTRHLPLEQRKPSWRMIEHPVKTTYEPPPKQLYPLEVMEILRPLMFSDKGKVGHNVKFDLETVAKYYGGEIPPGPYHDTIVMTHVLDEDRMSYDLKTLTADWFKVPYDKRAAWYPNLGKQGTDNFGLDEVARYLAKDVRYAWMRFTDLIKRLERKGLRQVYDFEMRVYPSIMGMEFAGFPVDLSRLQEVRADLEGQIAEVEDEAWKIAGDQFPLSNLDAKRWVLFGKGTPVFPTVMDGPAKGQRKKTRPLKNQGLSVRSRTAKQDVPQVTGAVLEYYADRGNRMAELLKTWAELEKLRGTFIEGIHDLLVHNSYPPTVHTGFKLHGTVTGRLSAAEPNIHQLPREQAGRTSIRNLFVAGPGRRLIVADYDQIELRCAGFLSEDPEMIRVFKRGEDIHRSAAAAMFRIPPVEVSAELRQVGKTQNFAVLYGAGEQKIAFVAQCSLERAQELIRSYFTTFAQLERWKYRELQLARKRGDRQNPWSDPPRVVIPPFGRLRRLPMLFELEKDYLRFHAERQAINALCQGFAAYVTKLAMVELHDTLPAGARMIAQVHDEIIVLADDDVADEAAEVTKKVMEEVRNPSDGKPILGPVPLVVSAAVGGSWAEAKG